MDRNKAGDMQRQQGLGMKAPPIVSPEAWEAARLEMLDEGEGLHPSSGQAGRRASPDAVDGRREAVRIRRASGQG